MIPILTLRPSLYRPFGARFLGELTPGLRPGLPASAASRLVLQPVSFPFFTRLLAGPHTGFRRFAACSAARFIPIFHPPPRGSPRRLPPLRGLLCSPFHSHFSPASSRVPTPASAASRLALQPVFIAVHNRQTKLPASLVRLQSDDERRSHLNPGRCIDRRTRPRTRILGPRRWPATVTGTIALAPWHPAPGSISRRFIRLFPLFTQDPHLTI
jgi:hypothetical protein